MTPQFPIISVYNEGVEIISDDTYLTKTNVLGILNGAGNSRAFDSNGKKWNYHLVSDKVKDNFLTRLVANTVYNPFVDCHPKWTKSVDYKLEELKKALTKAINKDEDILTQFVDRETLKEHVNASTSFDEVYRVLMKYVFDVDEEEL